MMLAGLRFDRGRTYLGFIGGFLLRRLDRKSIISAYLVTVCEGGVWPIVERTFRDSYICGWIAAVLELWFPPSTREKLDLPGTGSLLARRYP